LNNSICATALSKTYSYTTCGWDVVFINSAVAVVIDSITICIGASWTAFNTRNFFAIITGISAHTNTFSASFNDKIFVDLIVTIIINSIAEISSYPRVDIRIIIVTINPSTILSITITIAI